jgi:hypothetical protein
MEFGDPSLALFLDLRVQTMVGVDFPSDRYAIRAEPKLNHRTPGRRQSLFQASGTTVRPKEVLFAARCASSPGGARLQTNDR